jgi:hypothetical protein
MVQAQWDTPKWWFVKTKTIQSNQIEISSKSSCIMPHRGYLFLENKAILKFILLQRSYLFCAVWLFRWSR